MTTLRPAQVIRRVVQAFNEHDLGFLEQQVTEDFERHDLAGAFLRTGSGGVEVRGFLQALYDGVPDVQLKVLDLIESGDRVVMRYEFSGTHGGEFLGISPTNRPVNFDGINIYRFEGDRISEVWQLWDWATVLHQMDALTWPPGTADPR